MVRSYDLSHEQRDTASELARLRAQFDLSWAQEAQLLGWLGLRDGLHVVELGCGPGDVTEALSALLPHSAITAVDHDETMLALMHERVNANGVSRATAMHASIEALPVPEDSFDFAIARYVFQHVPDPAQAAREALRVLRPGGKLAVIDVDAMLWGIAQPMMPGFGEVFTKAGAAQRDHGGDRLVGRKLWRLMHDAGFVNVQLHAFVYHSDALGVEPFMRQLDTGRLTRALAGGYIGLNDFARAQQLYRQFMASADAYVLMAGLLACGEKAN